MIKLYIKSINRQHQVRSFSCQLNHFEAALDTLSLIAAAGNTFIDIYMVEEGIRTSLPVQAFDGQDMTRIIRALQVEWEALLSQPKPQLPATKSLTLLEMMIQRIDHYETLMAEYDCSATKLEKLMLQAQEQLSEGPNKDKLLNHYHGLVSRHYQSMMRAQIERDKCLKRLSKLKAAYLD